MTQVMMPQKRRGLEEAAPSLLSTAGSVIGSIYGGPVGGTVGGAVGSAAGNTLAGTGNQPGAVEPPSQSSAIQRRLQKNQGSELGQLQKGLAVAKNSEDPAIQSYSETLQEAIKRARERSLRNQQLGSGGVIT